MNSAKNANEMNIVFPGPGTYNQSVIKENSKSILSNYGSFGGQSIGKEVRHLGPPKKALNTPGPGNYQLPSDFGHYQNKSIDGSALEGSKVA